MKRMKTKTRSGGRGSSEDNCSETQERNGHGWVSFFFLLLLLKRQWWHRRAKFGTYKRNVFRKLKKKEKRLNVMQTSSSSTCWKSSTLTNYGSSMFYDVWLSDRLKAQPGFTGTCLPPLSSSGSSQSVSGGRDGECGRAGREDKSWDVSQETGRARQITLLSHYQFYLLDPNLLIPLLLHLLSPPPPPDLPSALFACNRASDSFTPSPPWESVSWPCVSSWSGLQGGRPWSHPITSDHIAARGRSNPALSHGDVL